MNSSSREKKPSTTEIFSCGILKVEASIQMDLRTFYSPKLALAITGGTGFIGNALLQSKNENIDPEYQFHASSLTDLPSNIRLIHCAASISNTRECLIANSSIDSLVFETCLSKKISVVYCSTNNVYPHQMDCTPEGTVFASDYYSVSKLCGEHLFRSNPNLDSIILRIGDVFGYGQRQGNLFKAIASSVSNQQPLKLFGKGCKVRSFIHVNEIAQLILFLSEELVSDRPINSIVNGAIHAPASIREIVEYVAMRTNLEVTKIEQADDDSEHDVRSMVPFSHPRYKPKFASLWDSLDYYVNSCLTT
jgi:nucleoside-diphosphate-sugar epimerase